ncbi:RHS repeat-associated core domain-containing protein [Bacillus cereus MC118]|uniref:RHS repeat-associated core domain-containing protein n=1 Tax=Bacillus cereus MC67 TaxID=1053219 RepID=J8F0K9_BACCE|nr:RHS repeat-associated core domain-containing protein [Bacillus cereus MC67]EOP13417.1 RHS repeat-associated core domain-containing protein [Bacillus cereus MC118]
MKVVENGKETKSIAAIFNEGNQLVKFGNESLTYDANGNRTSDGKYKYTWNENDQIVTITKQGESNAFATYKYDEDNRRIEKNVNGQVTRYFYDGDSINPLYETDGNGNVLRQYVYSTSGTRLAMKSKGQTLYYHYNPRGDVVAMTDQNREVVATYEYDAWGNVLKSDTKGIAADNPFGYAGYMYDKEIGMYYLIARYYNPEHGVFLSVDPDPGDEDDPITMNGYTYGDNNPVMMIDPDGHLAAGIYFVPGVGQAVLLATLAVGGAYGAWYLGKKLRNKANERAKKRSWDHIKSEHGPKSNKKMPNGAPKGKFKSNKTMKRTTRSTGGTGKKYTQPDGLTVHLKKFKNWVGTNTSGRKTKKVKVVKNPKTGRIVTSFPY